MAYPTVYFSWMTIKNTSDFILCYKNIATKIMVECSNHIILFFYVYIRIADIPILSHFCVDHLSIIFRSYLILSHTVITLFSNPILHFFFKKKLRNRVLLTRFFIFFLKKTKESGSFNPILHFFFKKNQLNV